MGHMENPVMIHESVGTEDMNIINSFELSFPSGENTGRGKENHNLQMPALREEPIKKLNRGG